MKANASWKGPTTEITTTEYENGAAVKIKAKFRVYSSYLEALSDYVGLLSRNRVMPPLRRRLRLSRVRRPCKMRAMPPTRTMRVSSPA
ncbi:flagellar rod assembly protein/muramidase FlgJ [Enterobacter cloacae]|uniref:Flagellar rod assembly protein/muramidase FlgJ n=1 Tax=Enterobacter cloacae TaxID=550 RepID=A0A377M437_ENTCL|nr:flagellar rod assembly protein/muramidase FlgJ [Enterobacter cloacae]